MIPDVDGKLRVLFRLGGLLDSAEKVKEIAGLEELPAVVDGQSEMGMAKFCLVDEKTKNAVDAWLAQAQVVVKRAAA